MSEPVRSFCARVINLCDGVTAANILTDVLLLKQIAEDLKREAIGVQTIYGGRPSGKG